MRPQQVEAEPENETPKSLEDNNNYDKKPKPFHNSTHGYMIYFESISTAFLGILVVILQFILYIVIIYEGFSNRDVASQEIPVTISRSHCESQYNSPSKWMECSAPTKKWGFMYLSMLVCSIYLQHDYTASLKVLLFNKGFWMKLIAILILFEALLATIAASLYTWLAVINQGGFEAIMNTVSILFIHELDYKLYDAVQLIDTQELEMIFGAKCVNGKKGKNLCIIGFTLVFIAGFILITVECLHFIFELGMDPMDLQ